ncbi:uncharacterized protein [Onthophagus taurus]|uniref:uncharacterized protein n=1 Tax=Onthophagus taurus TaxID=166361 RepID=UPI000C202E14|nr:mite allergen Der p 7-like [Onthophagus taurus]
MKFVLAFLAVVGIAYAASNVKVTSKSTKDISIKLERTIPIKNPAIQAYLTKAVQERSPRLDMTIDFIVDKVLGEAVDLLLDNNLDPLSLPEIHLGFEYQPALITYHGELDMVGGWVQDIITIHRTGSSTVSLDGNIIGARIPIGFDDIILTYLYSATIMDLGPHGSIHGKLYDVDAYFDVTIDTDAMTVTMNEFNLNTGKLSLKFYGYGIIDWLVNLLIDVVEDVLHEQIVDILNKVVGAVVEYIVEYLNENLGDLLGRHLEGEPKLTIGHQMPKVNLRQILRPTQ